MNALPIAAKLDSVCSKLGCFKHFTNEQCPMAHLQSYHQHIICEICGTKHLKKNIKRHLRTHESGCSSERVKRHFKGCLHTFLTVRFRWCCNRIFCFFTSFFFKLLMIFFVWIYFLRNQILINMWRLCILSSDHLSVAFRGVAWDYSHSSMWEITTRKLDATFIPM